MPPSSTVTEGTMRWCRYAKETAAWAMKRRAASHAAIRHSAASRLPPVHSGYSTQDSFSARYFCPLKFNRVRNCVKPNSRSLPTMS